MQRLQCACAFAPCKSPRDARALPSHHFSQSLSCRPPGSVEVLFSCRRGNLHPQSVEVFPPAPGPDLTFVMKVLQFQVTVHFAKSFPGRFFLGISYTHFERKINTKMALQNTSYAERDKNKEKKKIIIMDLLSVFYQEFTSKSIATEYHSSNHRVVLCVYFCF